MSWLMSCAVLVLVSSGVFCQFVVVVVIVVDGVPGCNPGICSSTQMM